MTGSFALTLPAVAEIARCVGCEQMRHVHHRVRQWPFCSEQCESDLRKILAGIVGSTLVTDRHGRSYCAKCDEQLPESARACAACGAATDDDAADEQPPF